jgi:arginine repressor
MRAILDKDLKIIERIQDAEEISPIDEKKLAISQARISKYLDKLHASKESSDVSVSGTLTIQISEDVAKKYNDTPLNTETSSTE